MSTKTTLILSEDNEHVYYDCSDDTINIEIESINIKTIGYEKSDGTLFLTIKGDCNLAKQLYSKLIKDV